VPRKLTQTAVLERGVKTKLLHRGL